MPGVLFLCAGTREGAFVPVAACWWFRRVLQFSLAEGGVRAIPKGRLRRIRDRVYGAGGLDLVLTDSGGASHRFIVPDAGHAARQIQETVASSGPGSACA